MAVFLVLIVRQTVVEAFMIHGASMAPTFISRHYEVRCHNCGFVFQVGEGKTRDCGGHVQCPNCRNEWTSTREALGAVPETSADPTTNRLLTANTVLRGPSRVFVNKFIYQLRSPRRWEVVVFNVKEVMCASCHREFNSASDVPTTCAEPGCDGTRFEVTGKAQGKNYIKRVLGLPGERIQIVDGDVYANGRIVRKPADIQSEMWIPVYDSKLVPKHEVLTAWNATNADGFVLDPQEDGAEASLEWAALVRDYYAYNGAGSSASDTQLVGDCRLRTTLTVGSASSGGAVTLAIHDGGHRFELVMPVGSGRARLLMDGESVKDAAPSLAVGVASAVSMENYDDRIVVYVDGAQLLVHDYEPTEKYWSAHRSERAVDGTYKLGIKAASCRVQLDRVRIGRDLHYADRSRRFTPGQGECQLADTEYFVMGDNNPCSSDSTSSVWLRPGVSESRILGRAFFVFWPVQRMRLLADGPDE